MSEQKVEGMLDTMRNQVAKLRKKCKNYKEDEGQKETNKEWDGYITMSDDQVLRTETTMDRGDHSARPRLRVVIVGREDERSARHNSKRAIG